MFAFNLPKWAAINVSLPTGGMATFLHIGDGRFLSRVPPLVLFGVTQNPDEVVAATPEVVTWDGTTLPGDQEAVTVQFGFDVSGAAAAVEAAAAAGDAFARVILGEMADAQRVLDVRAKLGILDADVATLTAEDAVALEASVAADAATTSETPQ